MIWPSIDRDDVAANDLGDERRFVERQRKASRLDRGQLYADHRQRVVAEDHLQDERGSTKDDGVGARDDGQDGKPAELHSGEHDPHHQAAAEAKSGDEKRVDDAGQQIGLAEIMEEKFH